MAGPHSSKIHLTVRVLPPKDVVNPPDAASFLLNLAPELTFFVAWKLIEVRYQRDYPRHDWVFKKIQDAHGADISLGDTVGDVFGGEDRTKCVVHVLQMQSHREDTVPEGSHLRPPQPQFTKAELAEKKKLREEEARYGATVDKLDPDHPVQSAETAFVPDVQQRDGDGFLVPQLPASAGRSTGRGPLEEEHVVIKDSQESIQSSDIHDNFSDAVENRTHSPAPLSLLPIKLSPSGAGTPGSLGGRASRAASRKRTGTVWSGKDTTEEDGPDITVVDPIEDDEDDSKQHSANKLPEEPDLATPHDAQLSQTSATNQPSQSRDQSERPISQQEKNLSRRWSTEETDLLITALARELGPQTIRRDYFPQRTYESIRKKAGSFQKLYSSTIAARQQTLAAETSAKSCTTPRTHVDSAKETTEATKGSNSNSASQRTTRPTKEASKTPQSSQWSPEDDKLFTQAIRDGQDWRTLHDRRFPKRSDEAFKNHFAEVRRKLEAEDAAAERDRRVKALINQGRAPSAANERYKQYEDDLLLAARLEGVEIKRLAKFYYPLRTIEQVNSRTKTLFHNAQRAASKSLLKHRRQVNDPASLLTPTPSVSEPTVEQILACLDPVVRERVNRERQRVRADVAIFASDRSQKYLIGLRVAKDRARIERYREQARISEAWLAGLEDARQREEETKARRLAEDLENERIYGEKYAAWYEQAELDEAEGRPLQPSPQRPLGSRIGTELVTVDPNTVLASPESLRRSDNSASSTTTTTGGPCQDPDSFTSLEPAKDIGEGSLKRQIASDVEVQIPVTKKHKTDHCLSQADSSGTACSLRQGNDHDTPIASTEQRTPTPFRMLIASHRDDRGRFASSQPLARDSIRDDRGRFASSQPSARDSIRADPIVRNLCMSSPVRPSKSARVMPTSKTRQSTLTFAKLNGTQVSNRSTRERQLWTPSSTSQVKVPESAVISSDDSSSYSDSDINDEDLTELVDRSSEIFRSSPPHEDHDQVVIENNVQEKINVVTMSPPAEQHDEKTATSDSRGSPHQDGGWLEHQIHTMRETNDSSHEARDQLAKAENYGKPLGHDGDNSHVGSQPISQLHMSPAPDLQAGQTFLADKLHGLDNDMTKKSQSMPAIAPEGAGSTGLIVLPQIFVSSEAENITGINTESDNRQDDGNLIPKIEQAALVVASVDGLEGEIEEINPKEIWRSPHHDEGDKGYYDGDDMMDMDDARDLALALGQYYQGDAPGTWAPRSPPQTADGYLHLNPMDATLDFPEKQLLPELTGQLNDEERGSFVNATNTMTPPQSRIEFPTTATQDLIPPFPSSGRVRAVPASNPQPSSTIFNKDGQEPRLEDPVLDSPTIRTKAKTTTRPIAAVSKTENAAVPAHKQKQHDNAARAEKARQESRRKREENNAMRRNWRDQLLKERVQPAATTTASTKSKKKKANKGRNRTSTGGVGGGAPGARQSFGSAGTTVPVRRNSHVKKPVVKGAGSKGRK